jgi:hypothetical protein
MKLRKTYQSIDEIKKIYISIYESQNAELYMSYHVKKRDMSRGSAQFSEPIRRRMGWCIKKDASVWTTFRYSIDTVQHFLELKTGRMNEILAILKKSYTDLRICSTYYVDPSGALRKI